MKQDPTEDRAAQAAVAESLKCMRAGVKAEYKCLAVSIVGEHDSDDELICLNGTLESFLPSANAAPAQSSGSTKEEEPPAPVEKEEEHEQREDPDWGGEEEAAVAAVAEADRVLLRSCAPVCEMPPAVAEAVPGKAAPPRRVRSNTPSRAPEASPPMAQAVVLRSNSRARSRSPSKLSDSDADRRLRFRSRCSRQERPYRGRGARPPSPPAVAARGEAVRSEVKTAILKLDREEARLQELKPQDLPGWIGLGNGMLATWLVGYRANADDLLDKLRISPFDVIIVQSTPDGFNNAVRRALSCAAECSKSYEHVEVERLGAERDDVDVAVQLAWCKSVHEMMSNTFAVVHRKKVKNIGTVEYALGPAQAQGTDAAVAEMVTSRSRWGQSQLGTISMSLKTTKQRMESIKLGVVYRRRLGRSALKLMAELKFNRCLDELIRSLIR